MMKNKYYISLFFVVLMLSNSCSSEKKYFEDNIDGVWVYDFFDVKITGKKVVKNNKIIFTTKMGSSSLWNHRVTVPSLSGKIYQDGRWKILEKEGKVYLEIGYVEDSIYNDIYEMKIYKDGDFTRLWLKSDKIEFLGRRSEISLEKPTVKIDWNFIDTIGYDVMPD